MIETAIAKDGSVVLKKNGRFLASSIDPVSEAKQWVRQVLSANSRLDSTFIIFGIGSGYHIAEMQDSLPKQSLLVLENSQELVDQALKIFPQIQASNILVETDWLRLVDHPKFVDAVSGQFKVAKHVPSVQTEEAYFAQVQRLLLGRDRLAFLVLLKSRPEFLGLLEPKAIGQLGDEPISIKTICKLFRQTACPSRERRIWRALEELVV